MSLAKASRVKSACATLSVTSTLSDSFPHLDSNLRDVNLWAKRSGETPNNRAGKSRARNNIAYEYKYLIHVGFNII